MHKLTLLASVTIVLSCGLSLMATPVPCAATGTYATLEAYNAGGGCLINGLIFNNFAFTPTATGGGTLPTAAQVAYSLDNPGTSTGTGQSIYGFEFNPGLSVSGIGKEDIDISYTILAPTAEISSIHLLQVGGSGGTGSTASVNETDLGCTGPNNTNCTALATLLSDPTNPHQDLLGIGPYLGIDVFKDMNATSITANGFAALSQVRDSVDLNTTSTTPEPATFALFGAGLIGVGYFKLRSRKS